MALLSILARPLILSQLIAANVVTAAATADNDIVLDPNYSINIENASSLHELTLELSHELAATITRNLQIDPSVQIPIEPSTCCTHRSNGYQECHAEKRCNSSSQKCLNSRRCGAGNQWMEIVPLPKTGCCAFDATLAKCPINIHDENPECHYSQADCEDLNGGSTVCGGRWITDLESEGPTVSPTGYPTWNPTISPTLGPSGGPTDKPTTSSPTTKEPSASPSASPSGKPTTASPTTSSPTTESPTATVITSAPTASPTTASPITASPTTASPTTASPITTVVTSAPTDTPTTASPTTASPTAKPTPATVVTDAPTDSPTGTTDVTPDIPLVKMGNNGLPVENFPLGLCEGDCDNDGECADGLYCFQRNGFTEIPGCEGPGTSGTDYCFKLPEKYLWKMGNNWVPAEAFPLGVCEGDCDRDSDCAEGLKCFQRDGYTEVPGCDGLGNSGADYCFDPSVTVSPTTSPTISASPTDMPSNSPTYNPTTSPTNSPTSSPTVAPTVTANSPTGPPNDNTRGGFAKLGCPPVGMKYNLSPGLKLVGLSGLDEFCGIFLQSSVVGADGEGTPNLIPFARSYDGGMWEAAPGPHASPQEDILCTTSEDGSSETLCGMELPSIDASASADSTYVILTKDGTLTQEAQIAKFLEMTTFGPTKTEITSLNTADWGTDARSNFIRDQMDLPATSHREYFRRRANTKWDASAQTARSDHPCSRNSKWRRYSFIEQDTENAATGGGVFTTFEVVPEEADYVVTIYEADSTSDAIGSVGTFKSSTSGYTSGTGYYDMGGNGDYIEWNITPSSAGAYPLSFRFANGSSGNGGRRPLELYVNEIMIDTMDFSYTENWNYWRYSAMVNVDLNEGSNTIKLLVNNGYGGPNIDHMRIGKPPAVVIKTNGWPRTVARNGVRFEDEWDVDLNLMSVIFDDEPNPPQGGLFFYEQGRTHVGLADGRHRHLDIGNPPIDFTGYEHLLTQNYFTFTNEDVFMTTGSHLFHAPLSEGQEVILTSGMAHELCDSVPPFAEELDAPVFGQLPNGEWLIWSPSILLEDNGPSINTAKVDMSSATLEDGGGSTVLETGDKVKCSNVPRNFINEDTCVLSTASTACTTSNVAGDVEIEMSTTTVIQLYNITSRYVYAIRGLAMENLNEHPCSKPVSRWEYSKGTTCSNPTSLNPTTSTALKDAISKSSDNNPFIRDVTRVLLCDPLDHDESSDTLDIQIQVGSDCYTHVHPDHLNVYDFTVWVDQHPGGAYTIQKWAQGFDGHEGWYLMYPVNGVPERSVPEHPMSRWYNHGVAPKIVYVSRLGDGISYRDLPSDLKTDEVADHFGAVAGASINTGGVIVCGSRGEVSNDPLLNEVFAVTSNVEIRTPDSVLDNQKHVVWTEVNLFSDDQLRQRMAWALAQILTVVPSNVDGQERTELYTSYYDIFVRHAFGNYRDILGEISYSPIMAEHLSYLRSKSHAYVYLDNKRISRADENFAREVMQLFSIGLIKLNNDGTPQLDSEGSIQQAYSNEDIESFARAWTGFDLAPARGNIEDRRTTENRLDPMRIEPAWRDPFPKANLNAGFIGDRYELCDDIPAQSFLKAGARYRLLGGSSSPELMKDPSHFSNPSNDILKAELDPSSPLYQRLHNEGNYELNIMLDNDLECNGIECSVDTLRVVKVGNVHFEFVEKPCVQLAFYNDGKRIQLRDSTLQGQMCANPSLAHARTACCRPERYGEVRSATMTYLYEGERVKFSSAEDRCGSLCLFEAVSAANWWREGYHWTPTNCSINVKVNSEGYVAIVHDVDSTYKNTVPYHVEEVNTLNWFRVFWDTGFPGDSTENSCAVNNCKAMDDGSCLCKTTVTESAEFTDINNISKEDVLSRLFIGTSGPEAGSIQNTGDRFIAHIVGGVLTKNTVFEVEDKGRRFFLKNLRSTVNLEGWEKTPEILEAESATMVDATVMSDSSSATGGSYVDLGSESSLEWNVNVNTPGQYLISFRYALDSHPRPLSVFVNWQEVQRQPANPIIPIVNYGGTPPADRFPLQRCEGDCDNDNHCADGLFCKQNSALEENPGCSGGTNSGHDYCVDPLDYTHGVLFYPTGGWTDDWHYSAPLEVTLVAGQNNIKVQIPSGYSSGPNIDNMKVEGYTKSPHVVSSFRNPPHFMSLISDYSPYGIGEQTLRDAQYETDAVLDHYFYEDNVAPFLCTRIIQRFGVSNPSPRYVSECTNAFTTGLYSSGPHEFGSGEYGSLEAMTAAIVLDNEATSAAVTSDPGHGSLREPILKVLALMRSMEYQTKIPDTVAGTPMHNDFHVRLWEMDDKIGQGPYEFPSVFSFFLPGYIPDSGPVLSASYASPESMLITMPNAVALLNGMFSLIKYGLGDCNDGFSTNPRYSSCNDDGQFERSYGHLTYQPEGTSISDKISDLALVLTADRLSNENRAIIEAACSSEPDDASIARCIQQLIVSTGEFHSTNHIVSSGKDRTDSTNVGGTSDEPYKAIIYFNLGGGCDSFNMLVPHTCAPIDVYEKYRTIRGKSDTSEGVGIPKTRLLEVQTNHASQPCTSFGIHEQLTAIKELYDNQDAIFITNAGLLSKPVDKDNYSDETPVQLFSHNDMSHGTSREDLADKYAGSGVGGRMADVLSRKGLPTNTFSISGQQVLLTGEAGQGTSQFILSSSGSLSGLNQDPSIDNMNDVIRTLNNATALDSGFFAETWSSKLSEAMTKQEMLKTEVDSKTATTVFPVSTIGSQLEMVTRIMQTHEKRGVKRDIFYVTDGGYDTHNDVDMALVNNFGRINAALAAFVSEVKVLNLWDSTTVVQFSEFARTLDPNTGDGSDHGWGGVHFMLGGSLNGGKVLGTYPDDFVQSPTNPLALSRGRMIPKHPWDAMWLGTAQWFGVDTEEGMDKVLPMKKNFDQSLLYDASELFLSPLTAPGGDIESPA